MEIWKKVVGYENYEVSSLGRVKSLNYKKTKVEKLFKLNSKDGHGYIHISLCKNGVQKKRKVHQLVAEAFLNHIPCGHKLVVNHINFDKTDNRIENLEIVTNRENTNRKHIKSSSQYTGVCWDKWCDKWTSDIFINGKNKKLGRFKTELEAHHAYEKAKHELQNQVHL